MDCYSVWVTYNVYSSYGTGADTLEAAVAKAAWGREYYEPLYPGTVRVSVCVDCEPCKGTGRIGKGRKNVRFPKYSDCPECKGNGRFPIPAVA